MSRSARASELEAHAGYWLRFVSNHVSHAFTQKVEARGVTVAEWVVLRALFDIGEAAPSLLAECLGMTRGAISKLIDRLCRKRLVQRRQSRDDRRCQSVCLSPAGQKLVPALAALADENDAEFFGHLTSSQRLAFVGVLKDIVRRHGWKDVPIQ